MRTRNQEFGDVFYLKKKIIDWDKIKAKFTYWKKYRKLLDRIDSSTRISCEE